MSYQAELDYLRSVLKKRRLQTMLIDPAARPEQQMVDSLREDLGAAEEFAEIIRRIIGSIRDNVVFKMADRFLCRYIFLRLPESSGTILAIGPYLTEELTHEQLLEQAEQSGVSPRQFRRVENYFSAVPVIVSETLLMALVETLAETLWGGSDAFSILDLNQELAEEDELLPSRDLIMKAGDPGKDMRMM